MIVKVKDLVKRYDELVAVDHFDMEVKENEVIGLLGPNGSGKSTTINCILSLLKYDKGEIEIFGEKMRPDAYDIKRQIGVVMQNVAVFEEFSVEENIQYFCSLYIRDKSLCKQYVEEAIEFTGLEEFRKFRPKKLSGGLLRRLNIACGIAHKPRLIILDEPTVAVDPQSRNAILEGIQRLNRDGATIIYTSHYMEEVEQICTRIIIMDKGKTLASGTKEQLKAMIKTTESVSVSINILSDQQLKSIKEIPNVLDANYHDQRLYVKFTNGKHNLTTLLEVLKEWDIAFSEIYSQQPTLNDVFLEITGKQLRD